MSDKPAVIQQSFPLMTAGDIADLEARHRSRTESLLAVDEAIAAIMRTLKETGELEDTLVLFASDNGHFGGEHRVPQGKYLAYEPSTRVPVMLRGPGVRRGAVARDFTVNTDLAATILDAAGAKAGRTPDGRSLLPFAARPQRRTNRPILLETGESSKGDIDQDFVGGIGGGVDVPVYNGVRTARYVYLEYSTGARELYDMKRDPDQMSSVHADPRYRRARVALDRLLTRLRSCRGTACRADADRIPGPSR
jgi:arylsulfatase A-like enzyme